MRKSWDNYFMDLAYSVATRGTCPRKQVGAVITRGNELISTGYNGSPPKMPHCCDVGCFVVNNHCHRTIHAEINALERARQSNRLNNTLYSSTLYSTVKPCIQCIKATAVSDVYIGRLVYAEEYGGPECSAEFVKEAFGLHLEKLC